MGLNNGIITETVGVDDVRRALGVGLTEVGALCTSNKINPFSRFKPIPYASIGFAPLDAWKNQSSRFIKQRILKPGKSVSSTTESDFLTFSGTSVNIGKADPVGYDVRWSFEKPTGGASSPYRLVDFNNYDHYAKSCDTNYKGEITLPSNILDYADTDMNNVFINTNNVVNPSTNDWFPKPTSTGNAIHDIRYDYGNLRFMDVKYGEPDDYKVGDVYKCLPANNLVGVLNNEFWRFGLIVRASGSQYCHLLAGVRYIPQSSLDEGIDYQQVLPSFLTNTQFIGTIAVNTTNTSFICYPCLLKDALIAKISGYKVNGSGTVNRTYVKCSEVYSMPSGPESFTMVRSVNVNDPKEWVFFGGYDLVGSSSVGSVLFKTTNTGSGSSAQTIYYFYFAWTHTSTPSVPVTIYISYTGNAGERTRTISSLSSSITINATNFPRETVTICQFDGVNATDIGSITSIKIGGSNGTLLTSYHNMYKQ